MRPVLSIKNLDVQFGDRPILNNINFDIFPHQVFVLMGPGGAGKSTILRSICAVNATQPNATFSGQMLYLDSPVTPDHAPAMVLQKAHLLLGTVFENLREHSPCRGKLSPLELRQDIIAFLTQINRHELIDKLDSEMLKLTTLQRKQVMIIGALRENPALLCLDEPAADLDDDEADELLDFIHDISKHRAILLVTHNQRRARRIGDVLCLVAGGRIQECSPIDEFFTNPQSQPARDYVRTGGCSVPSLNARPEDLEPDYAEIFAREEQLIPGDPQDDDSLPFIEISVLDSEHTTEPGLVTDSVPTDTTAQHTTRILPFGWIRPQSATNKPVSQDNKTNVSDASDADILTAVKAVFSELNSKPPQRLIKHTAPENLGSLSESRGPRNFRWLRRGALAGTPQPGLLVDINEDFEALKRVGVTHLITLTELPLENAPLEAFDIKNIHFPIVDMEAPTIEDAAQLCTTVAELLDQNATIAYHCRAGIGRTGTMLVAQLIWEGMDDKTALKTARSLYSAWVQSEVQEDFLAQFYQWVDEQHTTTARISPKIMTSNSP